MAVVNIKSTLVSNYDAQPRVLSNSLEAGGGVEETVGIVAVGATDTAASVYRVGFISSGVRISDVEIMNDSLTTGTSYKFGVALNTQDGGALPAALSDAIFGSVVNLVTLRNTWTSIYFPSILGAGGLVANTRLRIWELLGFTADTFKEYHLIMTGVTASTVGGNVAVKYSWVR